MTTQKKVIIPENLGKTIVLGALDPKKWDVKYDPDHFTFEEGKRPSLKIICITTIKRC